MSRKYGIVVVVLMLAANGRLFADEIKLPSTKGAANKIVAEFGSRDVSSLSNVQKVQLASAFNNLSEDVKALEICNLIPESWLAANHLLGSKAVYLNNVENEPGQGDVMFRELAFIQRCLDRNYGSRHDWLLRKASVLCKASVVYTRVENGVPREPTLKDAEQMEHAFETLKLAFDTPRAPEADLDANAGSFPLFLGREFHHQFFPVLAEQERFRKLVE